MTTLTTLRSLASIALLASLVLVACGGGGGDEPSSSTSQNWSYCDQNGLNACLNGGGGHACYAKYGCTGAQGGGCDFDGLSACLNGGGGNACYAAHGCANPGRGPGSCVPRDSYESHVYGSDGSCYCKIPYGGTEDSDAVCAPATVLCHTDCQGHKSCSFVSCQAGTTCGDGFCF